MFPVFSYKAAAYFYARSHLTVPFPSSLSLMTERHIADMLLGADAPTPTSHPPPTATIYTDPPTTHHGHFLPTNPMPPATHQPELHWLLHTITTLVDDLQHHPIVHDPIPPMSFFTNAPAYRLYLQLRNTLRHLINTTHEAQRGLRILQFLPGSPGSPGHYRMDPTVTFAPGRTNYLSDLPPSTSTHTPTPADTTPVTQTSLVRHLHSRHRSRSRDRLPLTTPTNPNLLTQPRQPLAKITPAAAGQRGQLHRALWAASAIPAADHSPVGPAAHPP